MKSKAIAICFSMKNNGSIQNLIKDVLTEFITNEIPLNVDSFNMLCRRVLYSRVPANLPHMSFTVGQMILDEMENVGVMPNMITVSLLYA